MVTAASGGILASSSPRLRTIATLIGFYPELEAAKLLLTQDIVDHPHSLQEIHELWERIAKRCNSISAQHDSSPNLDPLPKNVRLII